MWRKIVDNINPAPSRRWERRETSDRSAILMRLLPGLPSTFNPQDDYCTRVIDATRRESDVFSIRHTGPHASERERAGGPFQVSSKERWHEGDHENDTKYIILSSPSPLSTTVRFHSRPDPGQVLTAFRRDITKRRIIVCIKLKESQTKSGGEL